jgi:hypothetical protein
MEKVWRNMPDADFLGARLFFAFFFVRNSALSQEFNFTFCLVLNRADAAAYIGLPRQLPSYAISPGHTLIYLRISIVFGGVYFARDLH